MKREIISLAGLWDFHIPGGPLEKRAVPGSYHCVGKSEYGRTFAAPRGRALLCFEGIAYTGEAFLNGTPLGIMLPYSRYRFDVTGLLREGENHLRVAMDDLHAPYGPAEGWHNYSGIVRDCYLLTVGESYVEDVFFHARMLPSGDAECVAEIALAGGAADGLVAEAELCSGERADAKAERKMCLRFTANQPRLWSPDAPELYELFVRLTCGGETVDALSMKVGFKDFAVSDRAFRLNGKPLFLWGVCRHDLWDDAGGFTQTDEQIEADMAAIKKTGVNFVRLVHYPHDPRVLDAADRIGLLVSEEPGLWGIDMADESAAALAVKVLENVVRRDRSHVSVAFWLSFNECRFTEAFLRAAIGATRALDPTRLASGANYMNPVFTKAAYDNQGLDFYTFHPYGVHPSHVSGGVDGKNASIRDNCLQLRGKPLLFTEWGGYHVTGNPRLFLDFLRELKSLGEEGLLAGACYWAWQDILESNRGLPACLDGVLDEGLVTLDRAPKENLALFARFLKEGEPAPRPCRVTIGGMGEMEKSYQPIALPRQQEAAWKAALEASIPVPGMEHKRKRLIVHGPVLDRAVTRLGCLPVSLNEGRPLVVSALAGAVEIPVALAARALTFIGQCSLSKGWPIDGAYGEEAAEYAIEYEDGERDAVPIRNGIELTTVQALYGPSAIEPRAARLAPALTIDYDRNWEVYRISALRIATDPQKRIRRLALYPRGEGYALLLYGLVAEV